MRGMGWKRARTCFCQNINDIETRMVEGERYRVERIVASRGFDPVARILELRVSRSTVTRTMVVSRICFQT